MIKANGTNGTNGHGKSHAEGLVLFSDLEDKGLRDIAPRPCAKRLEHGGWCALDDGHEGDCSGSPRQYGPVDSLWHRHRGITQLCGKVTVDPKVCLLPRGHGGKCDG